MERVGLAVMRLQPLHIGHCLIINKMIQECEISIIGLGSAQKNRQEHDPYTVDERMQMIKNIYADRIKVVPLIDLGATRPEDWTAYIFDKLKKLGMKDPTDYYTGSLVDGLWYKNSFYLDGQPKSQQMTSNNILRNLHLLQRNVNQIPSATDIRMSLSLRTDEWKAWVPRVNHSIVEKNYPEKFKIPDKS